MVGADPLEWQVVNEALVEQFYEHCTWKGGGQLTADYILPASCFLNRLTAFDLLLTTVLLPSYSLPIAHCVLPGLKKTAFS